jgi:hypothetical protein
MAWPTFKELAADFAAMRRGEKRVEPYGTRGRVYVPVDEDSPRGKRAGIMGAIVRPRAKVVARIWNDVDQRYYTPEQQNRRIKQQIKEGKVEPMLTRVEDTGE